MYISSLRLRQFRNYDDATFDFHEGVTAIIGPNGSGKTNILEALYVMATGSSFRDRDQELTRYGDDWWQLQAFVDDVPREVRYQHGQKQLIQDGNTKLRISKHIKLPVVLFEPDDLYMMHSSPQKRRDYLDYVTSISHTHHSVILRRYERALRQRNALLKQQRFDEDTLFVWDISLVDLAEHIVKNRLETIRVWQAALTPLYQAVADSHDTVSVQYHSVVTTTHYKSHLLQALKANIDRDRMIGSTSAGPHRDDVVFELNNHPVVTHASRGEVRSVVIALKQAELQTLGSVQNTKPVLLLDDVFSELDQTRQKKLLQNTSVTQMILTSTQIDAIHKAHVLISSEYKTG
jgi:DNA replication and repair protein RecF